MFTNLPLIDPILIGVLAFVIATTLGMIVAARLTAKYLEEPLSVAEELQASDIAPTDQHVASRSDALKRSDQDITKLLEQHAETRGAINRHRQLLLIVIVSVFCLIVILVITRVVIAALSVAGDTTKMAEFAHDSKFWLATIGIGAFIQAFAATMLYSLQSFYRQSMQSFETLSRVYRARIALELLDDLKLEAASATARDAAKIEVIKAFAMDRDHSTLEPAGRENSKGVRP